jgi:uncharacterized protein
MLPDDTRFITNEASLRALHFQPMLRATDKVLRALDTYCRRIISLSPFCIVATQGPNGADVSPRGDPAGFVRVLDDRTLLVPDRVGNNRLDSMTNLLVNPRIGPSYAQMLLEHVKGLTPEENERQSKIMAERGLY